MQISQVFGNIAFSPDAQITRHNNFRNFIQGLMLLFRCATGEAWQQVMMSCVEGQQCDPRATKKGRNCGSNAAYSYFVSFIFFCSFLMLNLFVAVIMDNFDYLTRDSSILGAHHLDEFIRVWAEYDPNATGYIHFTEMYDMLRNMDPPLGFGNKCPSRLAYKKLIRMNMPITQGGKVNFTTTLFALIRENLNIKMRAADEMDQADRELRVTLQKLWPLQAKKIINKLLPPHEELNTGNLTVGKIYAGLLIHENWKTTRFGQKPGSGGLSGTALMARLMSAVRNSNTRASHASVDMNGGTGVTGSDSKGGGTGSGGATASGSAGDHFTEGPDRRSSFSYLRRASERRRRLRMKELQGAGGGGGLGDADLGDGNQDGHYQRDGYGNNRNPNDEDDDEQATMDSRRDSGTGEPRLRRAQHIYQDDEGEHEEAEMATMMGIDQDGHAVYHHHHQQQQHDGDGQSLYSSSRGQRRQSYNPSQQQMDGQRRQSTSDRLAEAVTDVMEFVREESFKRGKRHSLHRRRQMAASGSSGSAHGGASSAYPGAGPGGAMGECELDSDSAKYRRRRIMRRSPRRSAAAAAHQQRLAYLNDSDTGSMASMTQDHQQQQLHNMPTTGRMPMTDFDMQQQQQQQQRFRLQQHGGSVQDNQGFFGPDSSRGGQMMQQHRQHQSADACDIINDPSSGMQRFSRHQHQMHSGSGYISELESGGAGGGHPGMMSHSVKASEDEEQIAPGAGAASSSLIRPIQVGQSPPPLVGRADVAAARRKRDNDDLPGTLAGQIDDETAIHLGPESGDEKHSDESQVRFIAPSVAPLSSPSALIMPDEEIVPPDVPYRGRRLPQIPGSRIIRSAADFLHSSFHGRGPQHQHHHQQQQQQQLPSGSVAGTMAATTSNIAATPLVGGSRYNPAAAAAATTGGGIVAGSSGEPIFPSVSESPTSKIPTEAGPLSVTAAQASIVKRQPTLDQQQQVVGTGSSLDGSGSINFPRVSFSPTHGLIGAGPSAGPVASTSAPSYHSAVIATQSTGGTQSKVLAPGMGSAQAETMLPDRLAWTRGRLVKKEEKDDWF
uniref:Voltage-dependent calcium channel type A subunit alpha-1 n=1 Tax=Aceria tosichella TaxID=561515 RepID=A0A6G1SHG2_9ACAR